MRQVSGSRAKSHARASTGTAALKNSLNSSAQQPMIVKYVEALHNGIQSQALSRYAIGYILRGTKYI